MRKLKEVERIFLERVTTSYLNKRNGYWCYTIRKKHYKRSRILMQLYLNKKLEIWEVVHHKNKNKEDDRIENLEVIDASNHVSLHFAGVRRANLNKGVCNEKGVQSE